MAGTKKSTKKYEKKYLKGELERRRAVRKSKQRHQQAERKRSRRQGMGTEDAAPAVAQDGDPSRQRPVSLKDMTIDEFFEGEFDVPGTAKGDRHDEEKEEDASDSIIADHREELEALERKDPSFYQFLKENDSELLDFDSRDIEPMDEEASPVVASSKSSNKVTLAKVKNWDAGLDQTKSLSALKEVILAFKAAAYTNSDQDMDFKYVISSPEVFNEILIVALKRVPEVLQHHLPVKATAAGSVRVPMDSKKLRTLLPLIATHVSSIIQLLEALTDAKTMRVTLSCLEPLLPYTLTLRKPLKNLIKTIVGIWSKPKEDETVRAEAFELLRRMAMIGDKPMSETVLKAVYQGLVVGARDTTLHTLGAINAMKDFAVLLWGLDGDLGYTTGFGYIRQLALHLRNSITQPTKESHRAIYNWQYVHSLDFWSRVLSTHCCSDTNAAITRPSESPLHPLIYPLVQITLGALRLLCTPAYFPLRFHLTEALLRISSTTRTYIPLAPSLFDILQSPELRSSPRPATLRPLDFSVVLHTPKAYLRTRVYQDGVAEQVVFWLAEFFGVWAKSIAFPELIIPPTFFLKRWLKEVSPGAKSHSKGGPKAKGNANQKLNSSVKLLLQKLSANAAFVESYRAKVDYAVSNRAAVAGFLQDIPWRDMPLGAYVEGLRRQKLDREKMLEASRQEQSKEEESDEDENEDAYEDENENENENGDRGKQDGESSEGSEDIAGQWDSESEDEAMEDA